MDSVRIRKDGTYCIRLLVACANCIGRVRCCPACACTMLLRCLVGSMDLCLLNLISLTCTRMGEGGVIPVTHLVCSCLMVFWCRFNVYGYYMHVSTF